MPPPSNFEVSSMDRRFRVLALLYVEFAEGETSLPGSSGIWVTDGVFSSFFFSSFSSGLVTLSALVFVWMASLFCNGADLGFSAVTAIWGAGSDFPALESVVSSPCGLALASVVALVGSFSELGLGPEIVGCEAGVGTVGLGTAVAFPLDSAALPEVAVTAFGALMERMLVLLCREKGLGASRGLGPGGGLGLDTPAIWEASMEHSISESLKEDKTGGVYR